jgi:co-chaperonin GroES (HSP10)
MKSGYSPHKLVEVSEITKPALVAEEKVVVEVEEVREDEQGGHGIIVVDEDEEEEEEEEEVIGLLSTEELNKKCDDFIRKMKDDIKFEAQQLIMVRY